MADLEISKQHHHDGDGDDDDKQKKKASDEKSTPDHHLDDLDESHLKKTTDDDDGNSSSKKRIHDHGSSSSISSSSKKTKKVAKTKMEIAADMMMETNLHLTKKKYALDLLKRTNMVDAKPYNSPAISGKKMQSFDGDPLQDLSTYRSVVGALQYLTLTPPDLAFAVNQVCQIMHQPTTEHWSAVKHILCYVKGTIHHGLFFQPGPLKLEAYSDADCAGSPADRRSTSGYCVYLGYNLISWSAKKQPTVSRSSTESEYRQLAHTTAELSWLRMLFKC